MWKLILERCSLLGPAPMFTWVTEAARIELSGTTFLNAVSKASNMMRDGLDVEPGDNVYVDLGNHWQSPVWLSASLSVQAILGIDQSVPTRIVTQQSPIQPDPRVTTVVISRDPFGMPERELASGVINGSLEVRGFGDRFSPMSVQTETDILYREEWQQLAMGDVHSLVNDQMRAEGITPNSTIGITRAESPYLRLLWQVLVPIVGNCRVVLLDEIGNIDAVIATEQIDHLVELDKKNL